MADTNAPPPAFVAFDVASALATYAADFGPADPADQLQRLASALQASAPWTTLAKAGAMVVTTRPTPTIAVMGRFDAAGEHRLLELERTLHNDVGSLRFIDWPQVHYDVAALGEALRRHLGGDVARAQFLAIPRGGLIVLGLLAYELGLSPAQLNHAGDAGGPTVIVDDCALTGLRFREVLADVAAPHVVFAHLYSAPELRHALEADLRIATVIAARNLTDRAPALLGDGYAAWRDRWATRAGDQTSWVGILPLVGTGRHVLERSDRTRRGELEARASCLLRRQHCSSPAGGSPRRTCGLADPSHRHHALGPSRR